jgi:hypothetical protein
MYCFFREFFTLHIMPNYEPSGFTLYIVVGRLHSHSHNYITLVFILSTVVITIQLGWLFGLLALAVILLPFSWNSHDVMI